MPRLRTAASFAGWQMQGVQPTWYRPPLSSWPNGQADGLLSNGETGTARRYPRENELTLKRGYDVINRFSMLTGTFPNAFPMLGDADMAWTWYAENNRYATGATRQNPWTLRALMKPGFLPWQST